jgi:hypothetical protein
MASSTRPNLRGLVKENNDDAPTPTPSPTVKDQNIFQDLDITCDTDDCVTLHGFGFYLVNGACEEICVAKQDVQEVKRFVNVLESYYKYPLKDGTCASGDKDKLLEPVNVVNSEGYVFNSINEASGDGLCTIKSYVSLNSPRVSSYDGP